MLLTHISLLRFSKLSGLAVWRTAAPMDSVEIGAILTPKEAGHKWPQSVRERKFAD